LLELERKMSSYLICFLNREQVVDCTTLECANNSEALKEAQAFGRDLELWRRGCFVAQVDSRGNVFPPAQAA